MNYHETEHTPGLGYLYGDAVEKSRTITEIVKEKDLPQWIEVLLEYSDAFGISNYPGELYETENHKNKVPDDSYRIYFVVDPDLGNYGTILRLAVNLDTKWTSSFQEVLAPKASQHGFRLLKA